MFEHVDVDDFLHALGMRAITDEGEEMRFSCPFPQGHPFGDQNPSAYMNKTSTAFLCHACKAKGNAIHFLAELEGLSMLESSRLIRERYGSDGINDESRNLAEEWVEHFRIKRQQHRDRQVIPEAIADQFVANLNPAAFTYLRNRGFSADTIGIWQFGWDSVSQRIALPIRDQDGQLIGFKGRAIDERANKYMVLGNTHKFSGYSFLPYETSAVLFGLHMAKHRCEESLIVCEGELNVVAMHQSGYTNTVGISGSMLSPRQARLIKQFAMHEIILFFDSDAAGKAGVDNALELLEQFHSVKVVPDHQGDAASLKSSEIEELLLDSKSSLTRYIHS